MTLNAKFEAVGLPANHGFEITCSLDSTNGENEFKRDEVKCTLTEYIINLPPTETQNKFINKVQFYDRFDNDAFRAT